MRRAQPPPIPPAFRRIRVNSFLLYQARTKECLFVIQRGLFRTNETSDFPLYLHTIGVKTPASTLHGRGQHGDNQERVQHSAAPA